MSDPAAPDPRWSLPSGGDRRFDRIIKWSVVLVVLAGLVWTIPHWPNAWRWLTGREPLFIPEHPENLGAVDLEVVHRERWSEWIIAAARATPGVEDERLAAARTAMREAIAADDNLGELFEELDAIATTDRLRGQGAQHRAKWLTRAWNHYLAEHGHGYFVHGNVTVDRHPVFYAHMYRVVGDAEASVGDRSLRIRAVSRLDRINLREPYLGYASNEDEGAIVLSDRIMELAVDHVWPLLGGGGRDRLAQVFQPMILAELRRDLPGEAIDVLTRTAALRGTLVSIRSDILARSDCSGLWVPRVPFAGYSRDELDRLSEYVGVGRCAGVHSDELTTLWKTSEQLQAEPGLPEAAERLAAWVARSIAIHELRLVADDIHFDDDERRPCGPCESTDANEVRSEAAAFLAELAWSDAPATALFGICLTTGQSMGSLARARVIAMRGLATQCLDGPPARLTETARAIEAEQFGRSDEIVLGAFPDRLPVVPARDQEPTLAGDE